MDHNSTPDIAEAMLENVSFADPSVASPHQVSDDLRSSVSPQSRFVIIAAGIVVFLTALALAVGSASHRELWLDEFHSAFVARLEFSEAIRYIKGDVHPPLYFLLLREWRSLFGDSPFILRAFGIFAHGLAAVVFCALARRLFVKPLISFFCFSLFLFSPALFYQATDARMYPLVMLWTVIALLFFDLVWQGSPKLRDVVGFAVASALAFYSHYVALFTISGIFIFWLISRYRDKAHRRAMLLASAVLAVMTFPWLPTLFQQRALKLSLSQANALSRTDLQSLSYITDVSRQFDLISWAADVATNAASILGVFPARDPLILLLLAVPFLVICTGAVVLMRRREPWAVLLGSVALANMAGVIILGVVSRRYLMLLAPFFIVLIGLVVQRMFQSPRYRWMGNVLAISTLCLYISGTVRIYLTEYDKPTEGVVQFFNEQYQPGDLIIFSSLYGQVPFDYYAARLEFQGERRGFPVTIYDWWEQQPFKGWGSPVIKRDDLSEFITALDSEGWETIWIVIFETDKFDPRKELITALESSGRLVDECTLTLISASSVAGIYEVFRAARGQSGNPCPQIPATTIDNRTQAGQTK